MANPHPSAPEQIAPREAASVPASAVPSAAVATPLAAHLVPPVRVPRSALASGRRWRQAARWIGLALFAVGALMLIYVFQRALAGFQAFSQPDYLSGRFNRIAGDSWESIIQAVVGVVATEVLAVLYLLLLGFIASAIASKGIQFFAASEAVIDEAVAATE